MKCWNLCIGIRTVSFLQPRWALISVIPKYQCHGSGMFIPYPDFFPSRIQKQQQKRGVKKICCLTFFCNHKNHKIENYINFELVKKKFWANSQRITELLPKKLSLSCKKYVFRIRDPEKNLFRIPDPGPGVQKAPVPVSGTLPSIFSKRTQYTRKSCMQRAKITLHSTKIKSHK